MKEAYKKVIEVIICLRGELRSDFKLVKKERSQDMKAENEYSQHLSSFVELVSREVALADEESIALGPKGSVVSI